VDSPDHTGDAAASDGSSSDETAASGRAARLEQSRGRHRRTVIIALGIFAGVGGLGTAAYALVMRNDTPTAAAPGPKLVAAGPSSTRKTTTTMKPTTTTTIPAVRQPKSVRMPSPKGGLHWGSRGIEVAAYEARLKQLHFDPGPVDGYFDQDTQYAVTAFEKYVGLPRDGAIGPAVQEAFAHFKYTPAKPKAEGDRVEIDLDRQVLTKFHNWQPILISTTSTGSGERFCGGVDGCQYAITPAGHYHFYELHHGWQKGKLGRMWNPYYFNGGIAVHGLASVPNHPASHGCARIPMHVADYFYTLVKNGESVYVVGTPMKRGSGYTGPVRRAPTTTTPPTTAPKKKTTTTPKKTTTTPTTKPKTTTTHPPATTTPTT
jgi:peptidoglycan hydrolase-like protein with peptidoglycan-binding domain